MTNRDKIKEIADMPVAEQVNLLRMAARDTAPGQLGATHKTASTHMNVDCRRA